MFTLGALLAVVPYVPLGSYLLSSVTSSGKHIRQKVVSDAKPTDGTCPVSRARTGPGLGFDSMIFYSTLGQGDHLLATRRLSALFVGAGSPGPIGYTEPDLELNSGACNGK